MKTRTVAVWLRIVGVFVVTGGAQASFVAPTNQKFSFDADTEGAYVQTYVDSRAISNVVQTTGVDGNATPCLQADVHLVEGDANYTKGEVLIDLQSSTPTNSPDMAYPVDLDGRQLTAWFYGPSGSEGPAANKNFIQMFCGDADWNWFYGDPVHITSNEWISVSTVPATNQTPSGWMSPGFDPTRIRFIGVKISAGSGSLATYDGPVYVDGIAFTADDDPLVIRTNDVRYTFEPSLEGWRPSEYVDTNDYHGSLTGVLAVARSTNYTVEGNWSLKMDMGILCETTNHQKGAASVDMNWYPPPTVRGPFDLDGKGITAYVYCPAGSQSTNPADPNTAKLLVKDTNYYSEFSAPVIIKDDRWIELTLEPTTNPSGDVYMQPGFNPKELVELGVAFEMNGVYTGALYLDNVCFEAAEEPHITNTQHAYDFDAACQLEWWKWDTNPEGHHAKAWTNTYYATNSITEDLPALAANASFRTNNSAEVVTNQYGQVITNEYTFQKGVFEIGYQPAMNLSTKDHRRCQARLRFDPPIEGLLGFEAAFKLYDKITDQWYFKVFNVGGSGWNILDFDLDDSSDYTTNGVADPSPPGPMDASAVGFAVVQLFANMDYTGTVYLGEVVLGGTETGTNYNRITSGFVYTDGSKFYLDGSNFYHCGANIEYLQTVPDAVVTECLDWATNMGVQVVRTWAMQEGQPYSFQPERGVWNELMFEHLDRIVAMAGDRGIRLMLDVVDNWAHNGGVFQYVHWVTREHPESVNTNLNPEGVEYHDQFWDNPYCRQWYKDYVTKLLNRTNTITGVQYKNDPTIFAWEIVNEPRCESDYDGSTIHDWLHDMSDWFRTQAPNHLLGPGEEGGYIRTYEDADKVSWENYPDNYYHYGVYATGSSTCDLYGCGRGHGVDYISDMSSYSNYVVWQDGSWDGDYQPPQGEWRAGNSNIDFCTCRIYIDQKEYNVWRTNFNDANQRQEWINDHWYDSHKVIQKPMLLEEFGIHAIGWVFNGSYGQVQLVPSPKFDFNDRAEIYADYYRQVENCGIPGSYFWNFGYDGMWNDPFHLCDRVTPWYPYTNEWSAESITVSTNYVLEGTSSLCMAYNVPSVDQNRAVFTCPTNEMWVLRVDRTLTNDPPTKGINRVKFFWNVISPDHDVQVSLALRGTTENIYAESVSQTVLAGSWSNVMFDLSAGDWKWAGSGWSHSSYLLDITNSATGTNILEDVNEVSLIVYDLPVGSGEVYVDDIQIKRDDGFVVYADDPVCPVIQAHAARMGARNIATNRANNAPAVNDLVVEVASFVATNINISATDLDGDFLSYRLMSKPTNGWVYGVPPSNLVYKTQPGVGVVNDTFTYVAHDDLCDSRVATVMLTVVNNDIDDDDLPDDWEYTYFPKRVQWWPDSEEDKLTNMLYQWDWDGDGYSDGWEYYAGTDPTNSASYLWIDGAAAVGDSGWILEWPSVADRTYILERSTNLLDGFTALVTNAATPPQNVYTDTTASVESTCIYRVKVE